MQVSEGGLSRSGGGGGGWQKSDGKSTAPAWQQLCCSILVLRESDVSVDVVESRKRQVAVLELVRERSVTASHSCNILHTLASYSCIIREPAVEHRRRQHPRSPHPSNPFALV